MLTDSLGSVVEEFNYDSFGYSADTTLTRYGFTGRERDSEAGLLYYRARFYDPHFGRFISEDPTGFAGGINWYAYVNNRPLVRVDPTGLDDADRIWEERNKPPSTSNPWYDSHNETSDNDPNWERSGPPNQTMFGDGGIFTSSTLTEFITATERAKQSCRPFGERWWTSFKETNQALPGTLAPPGFGLITGPGAAQITDEPGLLGWAWGGGSRSTFLRATAQTSAVSLATGAAYEGGIGVGSYVNAIGCPCGYTSNSDGRLWRLITGDWSTFLDFVLRA